MFTPDFYPTPEAVITQMLEGEILNGKTILEPSAGKGNIIDFLLINGASVIACENHEDLKKILQTKCSIIESDFFNLTSDRISHIDTIVMNPPFSNADKHIIHAWTIAPAGCKIIALCNANTLENTYSKTREQLKTIIEESGQVEQLGDCFSDSERKTGVNVSLIRLQKPGASYKSEFEGFFMGEDEPEQQGIGLMPYNVVRDLVNRYVEAVKIFDKQLDTAKELNNITSSFFSTKMGFYCTNERYQASRNEFKKDLQKSGWMYIFNQMNLNKTATKGLREDINNFVEKQQNIPFTMKNIYQMLQIVIGTAGQRMDKALIEVFEKVTERCHENRYNLPGWKTNSSYLLTEKFIIDYIVEVGYNGKMDYCYNGYIETIEDMQKALCYITGTNYDECTPLSIFINRMNPEFGQWTDWGFFEIRGYKKGTMHFKFHTQDLWAKFNQHIARIKGYPLPENVRTPKTPKKANESKPRVKPVILETITFKT